MNASMTLLRRASPLLLLFAVLGTQAQVYRCGDAKVYTDKPCAGAEAVDLRANMLDAGPRSTPPEPVAQPALPLVLHDLSRVGSTARSPPSSIWQEKDSRDAAETSRTTGTFPR